jgi:hypothetical protein
MSIYVHIIYLSSDHYGHSAEEIRLHHTQMTGTMPSEVCNLTAEKLNLDNAWSESYFQADCSNDNETSPPFLACECCSTCCDHTTMLCLNRDV